MNDLVLDPANLEPPKPSPEPEKEKPPKSNRKFIIAIIVVLIVIGLGAAAALLIPNLIDSRGKALNQETPENKNASLEADFNANINSNANVNADVNSPISLEQSAYPGWLKNIITSRLKIEPFSDMVSKDTDNDGLTDKEEELWGTDPKLDDTDQDTYLDGKEVLNGFNPKGAGKIKDSGLAREYINLADNYSVSYPAAWYSYADWPDYKQATLGPIEILIEDNPEQLSASEYYYQKVLTENEIIESEIGLGVKGVKSFDGLTAYVADQDKIYALSNSKEGDVEVKIYDNPNSLSSKAWFIGEIYNGSIKLDLKVVESGKLKGVKSLDGLAVYYNQGDRVYSIRNTSVPNKANQEFDYGSTNTFVFVYKSLLLGTSSAAAIEEELGPDSWETYANEDLGISFSYPVKWGPVAQKTECPGCLAGEGSTKDATHKQTTLYFSGDVCALSLLIDDKVVSSQKIGQDTRFAAMIGDNYELPGRGGYWGDQSFDITSEEYVQAVCNGQEEKKCRTYRTGNNLLVARVQEFYGLGYGEDFITYYIYPNVSGFRGLVISTEGLSDFRIEEYEAYMDEIVNSLQTI